MRVCVPVDLKVLSGVNLFCGRLVIALKELGVDIVTNTTVSSDVALHCVVTKITNSKKNILRLDGAYHNSMQDYKKRNNPISKSLSEVDGVVYQSNFSKEICDKYVGRTTKPYKIIFNGISLDFLKDVEPANREADFSFLTSSRWRPQKRLIETMGAFLLADIKSSILYVAGDIWGNTIPRSSLEKYFSKPNIRYLGLVDQKILGSYLKIVDGFLHLGWIDNCPNSVVEAIGARVPVITNNVGGTQELVHPSGGFVLPLDKEYDLSPCRLYEPPKIDLELVASTITKCCSLPESRQCINNSHVDIKEIAKDYCQIFEEILCG